MYGIWRQAEALRQIDALAGFLATRYPDSPDTRRALAERAESGRAAAVAGDVGEAWDRIRDLRDHADCWAGHPHHPGEPGAAELDALVWDYAKDLLRTELRPGERDVPEAALTLSMLHHAHREICEYREADAAARADAHYLAGRGAMAVELGHLPAARRELGRLRAVAARFEDADDE